MHGELRLKIEATEALPLWLHNESVPCGLAIGIVFKVTELFFRLVFRVPVTLLKLADELLALSGDLVEVVVGQFAPLRLDFALHLMPLALQRVCVHGSSFE